MTLQLVVEDTTLDDFEETARALMSCFGMRFQCLIRLLFDVEDDEASADGDTAAYCLAACDALAAGHDTRDLVRLVLAIEDERQGEAPAPAPFILTRWIAFGRGDLHGAWGEGFTPDEAIAEAVERWRDGHADAHLDGECDDPDCPAHMEEEIRALFSTVRVDIHSDDPAAITAASRAETNDYTGAHALLAEAKRRAGTGQ